MRLVAGLILMAAFGTAEVWMLTHWQGDLERACQRQSVGLPGATTGFYFAGR